MSTLKQSTIKLLRRFYLLPLADYGRYLLDVKRNWQSNKQFAKENPELRMPSLSLAYDAYAHTNHSAYWASGKVHAQFIGSIINQYAAKGPLFICEWGCGSARVLRHLPKVVAESSRFYGTDYNPDTVNWCRQNIENIEFELNKLSPPLPFETNSFDCLYCISVFTHLSSEMHSQWMREISRVVKPNGLIIFTTHGDACSQNLTSDEIESYNAGNLVVRGNIKEGKRCYVAYHPTNFVKQELLNPFEVVSHLKDNMSHELMQDVWVVRNTKQLF